MKIIKRIYLPGGDEDLVAFITAGKKPIVYICSDDVFYVGEDFDEPEIYANEVVSTDQLDEYFLRIPLEDLKKITKVRLKK